MAFTAQRPEGCCFSFHSIWKPIFLQTEQIKRSGSVGRFSLPLQGGVLLLTGRVRIGYYPRRGNLVLSAILIQHLEQSCKETSC